MFSLEVITGVLFVHSLWTTSLLIWGFKNKFYIHKTVVQKTVNSFDLTHVPKDLLHIIDKLETMRFDTKPFIGGIEEADLDRKLDDWVAEMRSAMAEYAWTSKRNKTQSKKIV